MHGLIFETSVCYWQDQPDFYSSVLLTDVGTSARATEPNRLPRNHPSHGPARKATSDLQKCYFVRESTCSLVNYDGVQEA